MSLQFASLELTNARPSELVLLTFLLNDIHYLLSLRCYCLAAPSVDDSSERLRERVTEHATVILKNIVWLFVIAPVPLLIFFS